MRIKFEFRNPESGIRNLSCVTLPHFPCTYQSIAHPENRDSLMGTEGFPYPKSVRWVTWLISGFLRLLPVHDKNS